MVASLQNVLHLIVYDTTLDESCVIWLLILSVLSALLISAPCSLSKATLLSLRPGQIAEMANRRPRVAAFWQRFASDIERPIAAILFLNTVELVRPAFVSYEKATNQLTRETK